MFKKENVHSVCPLKLSTFYGYLEICSKKENLHSVCHCIVQYFNKETLQRITMRPQNKKRINLTSEPFKTVHVLWLFGNNDNLNKY